MTKANKELKKVVVDQIHSVEEILRAWDPIHAIDPADPDSPLDEYDSYAPVILGKLRSGADVEAITQHLNSIATQRMGLSSNLEYERKFAKQLVAWWKTTIST